MEKKLEDAEKTAARLRAERSQAQKQATAWEEKYRKRYPLPPLSSLECDCGEGSGSQEGAVWAASVCVPMPGWEEEVFPSQRGMDETPGCVQVAVALPHDTPRARDQTLRLGGVSEMETPPQPARVQMVRGVGTREEDDDDHPRMAVIPPPLPPPLGQWVRWCRIISLRMPRLFRMFFTGTPHGIT